jgi:hypothetical protein
MEDSYFQMNVTLEFKVSGGMVRSYEFTISGNSFKEIKERAMTLYAEISDSEFDDHIVGMPVRYHGVLIRFGEKFP